MSTPILSRLAAPALGLALAAMVAPAFADATFVDFAGQSWLVRTYDGGPGPNIWDAGNVFVDEAGLHLKITKVNGVWTCAEVVMTGPSLGFGTYEFEVAGRPDKLDTNVVLGLFNYQGSPESGPPGSGEIDIEFAQWGNSNIVNRLNWNIHAPVAGLEPGHHDAPVKFPGGTSTHRFTWSSSKIDYASFTGYASSGDAKPLAEWTFAPDDPASHIPQQPLVVHMNLWLLDGKAPSNGKPAEIVIRGFRFTPG